MKQKHKVILVKAVIALSGILSVSSLGLGITSGMNLYGSSSKLISDIAYILFGILVVVGIIMVILMCKIDIRPEKTKSKKYKITSTNFEDLKKDLFSKLETEGYQTFDTYTNDLYEMHYAIRNSIRQSYLVMMLKVGELSEELYEDYKNTYFEDFGNYLLEIGQLKAYDEFKVIYIICVDKVTKPFSSYTEGNVKQYWKRYNLPIGVSFASKTLYIATQKEGFAKNKYNKMKRVFMKYIKGFIIKGE